MESLEDFERYYGDKRHSEEKQVKHHKRHREKDSFRLKKDGGTSEHSHHRHDRQRHHRHLEKHRIKRSIYSLDNEEPENKNETETTCNHQLKSAVPEDEDISYGHSRAKVLRDDWMEAPLAIEFDNGLKKRARKVEASPGKNNHNFKIHKNELNHSLLDHVKRGKLDEKLISDLVTTQDRSYTFGDAGSNWRMTRLKAVYRQAEKSRKSIDEVAINIYGDLKNFDDAREEEIEIERRKVFGEGYKEIENPTGELFRQRKTEINLDEDSNLPIKKEIKPPPDSSTEQGSTDNTQSTLDSTTLNRMKAKLMKAKIRKSTDVVKLEEEYRKAMASYLEASSKPNVVKLGPMDCRLLAGTRSEDVPIDTKKESKRSFVKESDSMTIEDMVREERKTRCQFGGDSMRAAERIAKDMKFESDLEYMDDNASQLAKQVQKSGINLKNIAYNEYKKMNFVLDNCQLCFHESRNLSPIAPVISLGTRVYLTLPTQPELSEGSAVIVPLEHRTKLLECDDDEWEEIRNFMKCLTRMYHSQGRDVMFYENATAPYKRQHAAMQVVPLPYSLGATALAFFKEAILSSDEEWTQHKKLIDTAARSREGLGKQAFRRTIAKEMPYFHAWFDMNGGLGHIVEDSYKWPTGDLFAREVIGGMLDIEPEVIRKQGRWHSNDKRVPTFKARWRKFDWTRVLIDE